MSAIKPKPNNDPATGIDETMDCSVAVRTGPLAVMLPKVMMKDGMAMIPA